MFKQSFLSMLIALIVTSTSRHKNSMIVPASYTILTEASVATFIRSDGKMIPINETTMSRYKGIFQAVRGRQGKKILSSPINGAQDSELNEKIDLGGIKCGVRTSETSSLMYIVGGDEVKDGFWPWSVAIYEKDPLNGRLEFICSGSLISKSFVLTAAHCVQQSRFDITTPEELNLKIAAVRRDDASNPFFQVEEVYIHPEYRVDRKVNDIALLKLKRGTRLPLKARPICLPSNVTNRIDFTDQDVTIIGWGKTGTVKTKSGHGNGLNDFIINDESSTSKALLQAEVKITDTDACNKNYSRLQISWLTIDDRFICAGDPQGRRDACQGDSGGPLMWNGMDSFSEKWYQLGIVSFGHGCAEAEYPGVYTRIGYYMPWIMKMLRLG